MRRRRQTRDRRFRPVESLPDDDWTSETKVRLYRGVYPGQRVPLGTYPTWLDIGFVADTYGGGDYFFVVFRRRRILRTGIGSIEGNPIQPPRRTA